MGRLGLEHELGEPALAGPLPPKLRGGMVLATAVPESAQGRQPDENHRDRTRFWDSVYAGRVDRPGHRERSKIVPGVDI